MWDQDRTSTWNFHVATGAGHALTFTLSTPTPARTYAHAPAAPPPSPRAHAPPSRLPPARCFCMHSPGSSLPHVISYLLKQAISKTAATRYISGSRIPLGTCMQRAFTAGYRGAPRCTLRHIGAQRQASPALFCVASPFLRGRAGNASLSIR